MTSHDNYEANWDGRTNGQGHVLCQADALTNKRLTGTDNTGRWTDGHADRQDHRLSQADALTKNKIQTWAFGLTSTDTPLPSKLGHP